MLTIGTVLSAATLECHAQLDGSGLALSFNGPNGYAVVTNASVFNFTGGFTVEAFLTGRATGLASPPRRM